MKTWEMLNKRLFQIVAAFTGAMAFMLSGLGVSWVTPTLPRLLDANSTIPMTSDQSSWMVSILSVGCVVGILPLGFITSTIGRKTILMASAVLGIIGWIITIFASSVEALYVARFLIGVEVVLSFAVTPMYLTEVSEVKIRGILGTLTQIEYNIGSLIQFCVGPYVSYDVLAMMSIIFPIIFLLIMIWMPESPYFLLMRRREEDAEKALMKLRGEKDRQFVQEELSSMKMSVENNAKMGSIPFKELFTRRENRRALMIVLGLVSLQQFCGQLAVTSYTTQIFKNTASSLDADVSVIILGGIQTVFSFFLSSLVDRYGRKPLLIISTGGLSLSTLILGIYFNLENKNYDLSSVDWIPLVCLISYVSLFSLALGVLPFTIMGEIFLPNVKGLAASMALLLHAVGGVITTKIFQIMTDDIGSDSPFWLFFAYCAVSVVLIAWYLPETKGKTFTEINEELSQDTFPKKREKKLYDLEKC